MHTPKSHVALKGLLILIILFGVINGTHAQEVFTRNLRSGDRGTDVKHLQQFLNTHGTPVSQSGFGSLGKESDFFGAKTVKALIAFQELHRGFILDPLGLAQGTGNFFTTTKNFVNQLLIGSSNSSDSKTTAVSAQPYSIRGQITGINGTVMLTNGADTISLSPGVSSQFVFPTKLASGQRYSVQVHSPVGQTCFFDPTTPASGAVTNTDISVRVVCVATGSASPFSIMVLGGGPSSYIVTPIGDGNETITPDSPQTVTSGGAQAFTVTANAGYTVSNTVGGSCPTGSWSGSTYTTGAITAACSVSFSASIATFTIVPSADANGSILPSSPQTVNYGGNVTFIATPNAGYSVSEWTLDGSSYVACGANTMCALTNVTANHTVAVTFASVLSATVTPSNLSVDSGQTANFTANPTGGVSPYSYQWYSCTDSTCASSTIISGETNSTYNPSTATTGTYYYQAVVTDSASSPETTTTNVATLTVHDALSAIVSSPSSLSVYTNQTANFTANPTGGVSPYSYQWYSCTDSTCASSTIISGETNSTYNPSTATTGTYYYQAVVTDSASSPETTTTNVATLTVNSLPRIIFATTDTYTGNLLGLSGANQKCNLDPGKPGGFALDYNYKALLNGNNATVNGTPYYRTDGITLIATATSGNLVGLSSLNHSIEASGSLTVWTGANGNNCSNWTSTTTTGDRGAASSSTNQYWFTGTSTCSTARALYCVSQ